MGSTAWIDVPQLMPGVVASAVGYDLTALTPGVHRGLPSPYLTFIYSLSGPIVSGESLAHLGSRQAYRTEVLLGGLHQRPAYVEQPVQQAGIQLAVHPLAARALFGVPACELTQLAAMPLTFLDMARRDCSSDWPRCRPGASAWRCSNRICGGGSRPRNAGHRYGPRSARRGCGWRGIAVPARWTASRPMSGSAPVS